MNTSEVLNRAADRLERDGWLSMSQLDGCKPTATCAQVAIGRVVSLVTDDGRDAAQAFWTYLGGTSLVDIWHWNDADGRTAEQVTEALRAAAIIAAASEVDVVTVEPVTACS